MLIGTSSGRSRRGKVYTRYEWCVFIPTVVADQWEEKVSKLIPGMSIVKLVAKHIDKALKLLCDQ